MAMAASTLQVSAADFSGTKEKAVRDARQTQLSIVEECAAAGREAPPYVLSELIGKGSFGRVYKAAGEKPGQLVSVKIISIEEGDSLYPREADTFGDILKEVNALKLLNQSGARNINTIIDTLLVGQSVWMVTEYCAGGSVSTLMRPTGGLAEKWIIPILREVAEAIHWVHSQGIIHRDIKCANVLITEAGGVQLCDFGVAGIVETKFDKRSTVTGTLQWMAPELFDSSTSYGIEVDIWAFGSMAYEVASGFPPNAASQIDMASFGSHLKENCPRLEGEQYSSQLKDLIACCLVQDPAQRPSIEQVQRHPYILNTAHRYPTALLSNLVSAYKLWEVQGGTRRSLFSAGGAQGPTNNSPPSTLNDEWDFSAMDQDQLEFDDSNARAVYDAYGPRVYLPEQAPRPQTRRRHPNIKPLVAPLEQVFDPKATANYEDNARAFYGRQGPPPATDLRLPSDSEKLTARESLIDLDASLDGKDLSLFVDLRTIRPKPKSAPDDLTDLGRRTRDWKFPMMGIDPASAVLDMARPQPNDDYVSTTQASTTSDQRVGQKVADAQLKRASALSLIDLDASLLGEGEGTTRPSTAGSDSISMGSEMGNTPFELERHMFETDSLPSTNREPSLYVPDGIGVRAPSINVPDGIRNVWDGIRKPTMFVPDGIDVRKQSIHVSDGSPVLGQRHLGSTSTVQRNGALETARKTHPDEYNSIPSLPLPPSTNVMLGTSSPEELKGELRRIISSLSEHFQFAAESLEGLPVYRGE